MGVLHETNIASNSGFCQDVRAMIKECFFADLKAVAYLSRCAFLANQKEDLQLTGTEPAPWLTSHLPMRTTQQRIGNDLVTVEVLVDYCIQCLLDLNGVCAFG